MSKSDPVPATAAPADHDDHPEVSRQNTRNALILFAVYFVLYAGFMILAAVNPKAMGVIVFAGVNLAVIYGMALIVVAVLLAMIYMWLCSRVMDRHKEANPGPAPSEIDAEKAVEHEGGQA